MKNLYTNKPKASPILNELENTDHAYRAFYYHYMCTLYTKALFTNVSTLLILKTNPGRYQGLIDLLNESVKNIKVDTVINYPFIEKYGEDATNYPADVKSNFTGYLSDLTKTSKNDNLSFQMGMVSAFYDLNDLFISNYFEKIADIVSTEVFSDLYNYGVYIKNPNQIGRSIYIHSLLDSDNMFKESDF